MDKTTKNDCLRDRISARMVGVFILAVSALLGFAGLLIVPILGIFFAVPLLILGLAFIISPESKACRLLMDKVRQT